MRKLLTLNSTRTSGKAITIRLTLGLLASLLLGWLTARGLDWTQVWSALRDVPPHVIALGLLFFLLSNLARAYRWQILFVKERISVPRLFLIENIGLGFNNILPVRIASEAMQFTILTLKDRISRGSALATLGMTRVMDIWACTLLLALGLLLTPGSGQLARYTAGGFIFSLLLFALMRFLAWGSRGLPLMERLPLLRTFAASIGEMEKSKSRLFVSLVISVAQWIILGICGWTVAQGMNIPLSMAQAIILILATIFVATSLPGLPGAIGTFEGAMVYVMSLFNIDKNLAFPYTIVMHLILFLPPTLFAVLLLPREGLGSLREFRARAHALTKDPRETD